MPSALRAVAAGGEYTAAGGCVTFHAADGEVREVASGLGNITALAVSADPWRLFLSVEGDGCIYSMAILPDGALCGKMLFASLYTKTDLCVDSQDRVYAATEMGIQGIRSFGIIEAIVSLPGGSDPCADRVWRRGEGHPVCREREENL